MDLSVDSSVDIDVTVLEEDALGQATHAANGETYDQLNMLHTGTALAADTVVTIYIPSYILMPLSYDPLGVFVLYTATDVSTDPDTKVESAADASSTVSPSNYFTMDTDGASSTSVEFLDEIDGLGSTQAHYQWTFRPANPIPDSGRLVIDVPSGITVPTNAADLTLTCSANCDDSTASIAISGNVITLTGAFTGSYYDPSDGAIIFSL